MKTDEKVVFEEITTKEIADALKKHKIVHPTEIQENTIPLAIEGKDIIGRSKTGSGKTIAFSIPIVQELSKKPGKGVKALVLVPTRELAKQVEEEINMIDKKLKTCSIYGGVDYEPQFKALAKSDIVVGTPGRIIDHLERKTLDISGIEFFVLDEADRMLDMGFIDDIKKIIDRTPMHKQSFFFSATMPGSVRDLAESYMHEPVVVAAKEVYVDNNLLEEWYVNCEATRKADMLAELIRIEKPEMALIFVNSRLFTDKVAEFLDKQGLAAKALHGGHAQNKRERLIKDFEKAKIHILVATDVAARGLDIDGVTHVFNYEVPKEVETYTHRIGRTARAGRKGKSITLLDKEEHSMFKRIEGDSMRDINKYEIDFKPKKTYFLPKRDGNRGPRKSFHGKRDHSRRGPPRKTGGRRPDGRRGGPRKSSGGPRKSSGRKPYMPKH